MFLGLLDPPIIKQKTERKTLIPTVFDFFMTFHLLKNDVNVPSKSNEQKTKKKT
jgi:hypothetical protein